MKFELDPLPYPEDALEPYISAKTLNYHYHKHHKGYLTKLQKAIGETANADKSLIELIKMLDDKKVLNNAAQVWNHTFYWQCMHPNGGGEPPQEVETALTKRFGSLARFRDTFSTLAADQFGSGWAWLVKTEDGDLEVLNTANADNPMRQQQQPLLTLDVWEHAYYLDYQNERGRYIDDFFDHLINWNFVASNL